MIEQYSCYKFQICIEDGGLYYYEIYGEGCQPYDDGVIVSDDCFDAEQEARFAAIGHIDLLENGEG
jgi:hypothetical protein